MASRLLSLSLLLLLLSLTAWLSSTRWAAQRLSSLREHLASGCTRALPLALCIVLPHRVIARCQQRALGPGGRHHGLRVAALARGQEAEARRHGESVGWH